MQVNLIWSLSQEDTANTVTRYCPTCGRISTFTDTGKKRRNANGKNIFEYTIYRCEKGHTWNHKIRQYKASESDRHIRPGYNGHNGNGDASRQPIQPVSLTKYQAQEVSTIIIQLDIVEGTWRLDKLLSSYFIDVSRTEIRHMIKAGQILLNQKAIKPGVAVTRAGTIQINL